MNLKSLFVSQISVNVLSRSSNGSIYHLWFKSGKLLLVYVTGMISDWITTACVRVSTFRVSVSVRVRIIVRVSISDQISASDSVRYCFSPLLTQSVTDSVLQSSYHLVFVMIKSLLYSWTFQWVNYIRCLKCFKSHSFECTWLTHLPFNCPSVLRFYIYGRSTFARVMTTKNVSLYKYISTVNAIFSALILVVKMGPNSIIRNRLVKSLQIFVLALRRLVHYKSRIERWYFRFLVNGIFWSQNNILIFRSLRNLKLNNNSLRFVVQYLSYWWYWSYWYHPSQPPKPEVFSLGALFTL